MQENFVRIACQVAEEDDQQLIETTDGRHG